MHGVSNRDTHLYPLHNNSSVHLTPTARVRRTGKITNGMRSGWTTSQRLRIFIPRHRHSPLWVTLPRRAWVRLNRLHTGVGRFHSCLYKLGMTSSEACECGAEEPIVDHVVLQCPIHRAPHGLHGLTVLDDETIECFSTPAPRSSAAKQW